jgi:hypothetical protein
MSEEIAVLVIGYQRLENIITILEVIKRNNIRKIYISIDAPKINDLVGRAINKSIKKSVEAFKANFNGEILVFFRKTNRGCAASVISSCNWVFSREKFAIVLEDDCIPSDGFFKHVEINFKSLNKSPKIVMISGTQLAPQNLTKMQRNLSVYPMIWGWATSNDKWSELLKSFNSEDSTWPRDKTINRAEKIFWDAGYRRAKDGYIDVWDIVIARFMRQNSLFSILPPVSYISNIGNDQFATHTFNSSPFLFQNAESFVEDRSLLVESLQVDDWIREKVYEISRTHMFSTRVTKLIDIFRAKPFRKLSDRIDLANRDFTQFK